MNEQGTASPFLTTCEEYLAQGDIFQLELVVSIPDTQKRIFRTPDGRHGKLVSEASGGRVFSESDLLQTINSLPPEEQLLPFQRTSEGDYELVVVSAELLKYFIIVSQTCDISGVDSPPNPVCVIARVMTITEYCRSVEVPFPPNNEKKTIVAFLTEKLGESIRRESADDLRFPDYLRQALENWKARDTKESPDARIRNTIKNLLNNIVENRQVNTYYVRSDVTRRVPESFVEFSYLYPVSTESQCVVQAPRWGGVLTTTCTGTLCISPAVRTH
ncbi:MAG: hypothetical protein NZT92_03970 [Abditibacteriales bacterium]|nr:hypothetical protein [Abditibacteriales bacterium]MDW8365103.1 hypothetical protein [Abditibacteriales bacterium]